MSALAASMSFVANAAPMPPTSAPPMQGDEGRGEGFAHCLEQARGSEARSADDAAPRPNANKPASNAKVDRGARGADAARHADAAKAASTEPADAAAHAEGAVEDAADRTHDDGAAPDLASLLPGWTAPPATASTATLAETAAAVDGDAVSTCSAAGGAKSAPRPPRGERVAGEQAQGAAVPADIAASSRPAAAAPSGATQQAAEHPKVTTDMASTPPSAAAPTGTGAAAAPSLVATPKPAEPPQAVAMVPAPLDSPTFAPSLATQVRWWAHDGVQQAQLLLNPAEMGPVAVKIVIDGRDARIDFSADVAATRHAIEAALPVLAAALDDSGLKLSGGGVHDGSAQQQPAWRAHAVTDRTAAGAATPDDPLAAGPSAARSASGRGMVDLVA